MLLVEPEEYKALKESQLKSTKEPDDIKINKLNENLIKNKIIEQNKKDQTWSEFGSKLKPIITEGMKDLRETEESPSSEAEQVIDIIKAEVAPNYISKVTRLFNLLSQVDGINITSKRITVDGSPLYGLTVTNLSQLARPNRYLSFDLSPLLNKIKNNAEITSLIANNQAKLILNSYLSRVDIPPALLEAQLGSEKGSKRSREAEFESPRAPPAPPAPSAPPPAQSGSGLSQKKKKKIIWRTLF